MKEIYLIRHGQASFGSKNYDNLSNKGKIQSILLGSYFKKINLNFDKVICGNLNRQIQTSNHFAEQLDLQESIEKSNLLNEYNVKSVIEAYVENRELTEEEISNEQVHFNLLKDAVTAWCENNIKGDVNETWYSFQKRGLSFIEKCKNIPENKIAVVSSAGTISMIISLILNLQCLHFVNFHLLLYNSSFSKILIDESGIKLSLFNCISHLEESNEKEIITNV